MGFSIEILLLFNHNEDSKEEEDGMTDEHSPALTSSLSKRESEDRFL